MPKARIINCPNCKVAVAKYDGKSSINVIARCGKCRKRVVYHIDTGETELKEMQSRNSSSGVTYC